MGLARLNSSPNRAIVARPQACSSSSSAPAEPECPSPARVPLPVLRPPVSALRSSGWPISDARPPRLPRWRRLSGRHRIAVRTARAIAPDSGAGMPHAPQGLAGRPKVHPMLRGTRGEDHDDLIRRFPRFSVLRASEETRGRKRALGVPVSELGGVRWEIEWRPAIR